MSKRSEIVLSQKGNKLTTSSTASTALILREQPDKAGTIEVIANLLARVGTLWQIPNWTADNSVLLAEWIYGNYPCEPLDTIFKCLKNPPVTDDKIYRLTPDVITQWMAVYLEKDAIAREQENQRYKAQFTERLPDVDYNSFRKRIAEGTALREDKPKHWKDDPDYQKFKQDRMLKHAKEDGETKTEAKE
jgi:hypothetical protein